ncbi:hypothetical protein A6A04_08265 [Paramagnetospirillum marisnigri]|uniref:Methyltransferase n=1 Tax=Paramagnetospirillum marisnigri TaxID=1285242 RepID=A0A178M7R5_9PROT|nr:hypothetical protein [Paramagnetospirillum marisnigri]OAN44800.1 hypothetical protein A6A04_08265 [Paramagnetospirillum marisnigri]
MTQPLYDLPACLPSGVVEDQDNINRFTGFINAFAHAGLNLPGGALYFADGVMAFFRQTGFLGNQDFTAAVDKHALSVTERTTIWRAHTSVWAAKSCAGLDGDFVEFGTHLGTTPLVINDCLPGIFSARTLWLYDLFEADEQYFGDLPEDAFAFVQRRLAGINARIIKGALPDSFLDSGPERIAFAHLDVTHAQIERELLAAFLDRVVPGGIILFGNYGHCLAPYRDIQSAIDSVLGQYAVLELPTGQGLFVKR